MKYKDFEFVRRCIISCVTFTQLGRPISNLISLFGMKYNDYDLVDLLYDERLNHKLYKI